MTDVIHIDAGRPDPVSIARAAEILRRGGLVAFPTETVYGLGADALDRAAVLRLFAAKGRPANDPLIVHVGSIDRARPLVAALDEDAHRLAARFWPGPLTLVLRRSAAVPDEVTAGLETVALRIPSHPIARALLDAAGVPIAAPSANLFSRPSPTRASHVLEDLHGRIDLIIDGGSTAIGMESTVLDLSGPVPTVLRPGAITMEMLGDVLPGVEIRAATGTDLSVALPSPGMLSKHYSPHAPMTLYEGDTEALITRLLRDADAALAAGKRVGILVADEDCRGGQRPPSLSPVDGLRVVRLGPERDFSTVASRLYAGLRELDRAAVDLILVRAFPTNAGLGLAVQDRLRRAAGRIVRC
jgi:L-threonylcarbamoyladenylate synthase